MQLYLSNILIEHEGDEGAMGFEVENATDCRRTENYGT